MEQPTFMTFLLINCHGQSGHIDNVKYTVDYVFSFSPLSWTNDVMKVEKF